MTAKTQTIAVAYDAAAGTITWTVPGEEPVVLEIAKLHDDFLFAAAVSRLKDRGTDRAAIRRDPATGASASPAEKRAAIAEWVAHAMSGTTEWGMRGTPRTKFGALHRALRRLYPEQNDATIAATLKGMTAAERGILMHNATLAPILVTIAAEDAAAAPAPEKAAGLLARFAAPKAE
jgi:hypothetical protein